MNYINIDGTIINLDNPQIEIKWINESLVWTDVLNCRDIQNFKGEQARRAYEWLQSACIATFTDMDETGHEEVFIAREEGKGLCDKCNKNYGYDENDQKCPVCNIYLIPF